MIWRLFVLFLCFIYIIYYFFTTKRLSSLFILKNDFIHQAPSFKGFFTLLNLKRKAKDNKYILTKFLADEMLIALSSLKYDKTYSVKTHLVSFFKFAERKNYITIQNIEFSYEKNMYLEAIPFCSLRYLLSAKGRKFVKRKFYLINFKRKEETKCL